MQAAEPELVLAEALGPQVVLGHPVVKPVPELAVVAPRLAGR